MALEPSVLAELGRRTEGWAASLQLVRSALHDRDAVQVRTFISSLSGAEGHLYEYLAEEVVGDLPADLQDFLMRTSVLETIDPTLGPVAAGISQGEARVFLEVAELHGLVSRRGAGGRGAARAHPLVRDFLLSRLQRVMGTDGVRAIHASVAQVAVALDWQLAATHYVAAGQEAAARDVLERSLDLIVGTAAYAAGQEISRLVDGDNSGT